MKKTIILSLVTASTFINLLSACSSNNQKRETSSFEIEETAVSLPIFYTSKSRSLNEPPFHWNDISSNVKLIQLETINESLLSESIELVYEDENLIIIVDSRTNTILIFDSNGKFKSKIRKIGNGPGDYGHLTYVTFDVDNSTILVFDNGNQKIISYDLNGIHISSKSTNGKIKGNVLLIDKGKIITINASGEYQISLFDSDLNILEEYLPFESNFTDQDKSTTLLSCARGRTKEYVVLNNIFCDTIYSFSTTSHSPIAIFDKGGKELPKKDLGTFLSVIRQENSYILTRGVTRFSHFLLIRHVYQGSYITTLWDYQNNKVLAESKIGMGFPYKLDSGKSINIFPTYLTERKLAFFIPAADLPHIDDEDNPMLLIMEIND